VNANRTVQQVRPSLKRFSAYIELDFREIVWCLTEQTRCASITPMTRDNKRTAHRIAMMKEHSMRVLKSEPWPRLLMSFIMTATVSSGFLSSVALHALGVHKPLVRYPMAVIAGWLVFLTLIALWVAWRRRRAERGVRARDEAAALSRRSQSSQSSRGGGGSVGSSGGSSGDSTPWRGGGGQFGGAGASESFAEAPSSGASRSWFGGDSSASTGGADFDLDVGGDTGGVIIVAIAVVVVLFALVGTVIYAIYSAPTFFAELLIDGGIGTWLYRRTANIQSNDWLKIAVRRSFVPLLFVLAAFAGLGWVVQEMTPGATTIGEVFTGE
jgi:hypothetical protein